HMCAIYSGKTLRKPIAGCHELGCAHLQLLNGARHLNHPAQLCDNGCTYFMHIAIAKRCPVLC
ncbi:MAG: hypothetical protein ACT6SG_20540, partial [Hydrogenophaga sp.]|uniref:hypothetical protein n=1 Tax=Hydrogenophaga sp. TaxID=1904254 RepID=UPI0040366DF8